MFQVPLGEVQVAERTVGHDRGEASAYERGKSEGLLPVAPTLGEGSERAQGPRQKRPAVVRNT